MLASHSRAEHGLGWEAARPRVSGKAKPAKFHSLIEKILRAPLKENEKKFSGFAPPLGGGFSGRRGLRPRLPEFHLVKFFLLDL